MKSVSSFYFSFIQTAFYTLPSSCRHLSTQKKYDYDLGIWYAVKNMIIMNLWTVYMCIYKCTIKKRVRKLEQKADCDYDLYTLLIGEFPLQIYKNPCAWVEFSLKKMSCFALLLTDFTALSSWKMNEWKWEIV